MYSILRGVRLQSVSVKGRITLLALATLALFGCTAKDPEPVVPVSGGKSATIVLDSLAAVPKGSARPSGTLGIFIATYLAQGFIMQVDSATQGLQQILMIVRGQEQPLGDETFALLQTLGDILSVDVIDLLNRSNNRIETLDQYTLGLKNAIDNGTRRAGELQTALETLATQKKEQRQTVRDIERAQKEAIAAKDYSTASSKDTELLKAQTALSQTELTEDQTKDAERQLSDLLELAEKRLSAIEKNREILLSGLKITDPQGLKDLGLVQESSRRSFR
ncbi:MAG: hypothetical protein PeribacterA2_0624 [Candidatus Peribacter riflensis]|uniref:Uncharacterized protein n=1 Tax=Candidatus Peribacter riflensis TaxID=1735162 RepID=A0A0S1SFA3_9BACT|nr:MAG: hypothetical protein PeribacterA2_0624 [Candidatus Peribacter riflensis]ALM11098.1 MAG: hypothetical protein PeribacterB2_0624 [Candidatus Peribacter riflensis]ALM12201.1 MAG: hypothetical protein PeribacterC2_0624 [Candidatus Peribacter riflensis]ALM13304.1 MAG: hypothetical protein PeribacterD1_0625 [Candidatus Peribacter riflensis]ALM14404.1 MAG: hypothetical protein PeribacterD2_0624 [Candidatus Peribacter riflensis]